MGHWHACHVQPAMLLSKAVGLSLVMVDQENPLVVPRSYTRAAEAWRVPTCQEDWTVGRVPKDFAFCDPAGVRIGEQQPRFGERQGQIGPNRGKNRSQKTGH